MPAAWNYSPPPAWQCTRCPHRLSGCWPHGPGADLFGVALALVDAAVHRLPTILTAAATGGALALLTATAVVTGDHPALLRAGGCAVVLSVIYLALVLNDRMG